MVVGEGVASLASLQRSLTSQTKFYFGLPVPARQLAEEEKKKTSPSEVDRLCRVPSFSQI